MQKILPSTNAIRSDADKKLHCQNIITKVWFNSGGLKLQKSEVKGLASAGANSGV